MIPPRSLERLYMWEQQPRGSAGVGLPVHTRALGTWLHCLDSKSKLRNKDNIWLKSGTLTTSERKKLNYSSVPWVSGQLQTGEGP